MLLLRKRFFCRYDLPMRFFQSWLLTCFVLSLCHAVEAKKSPTPPLHSAPLIVIDPGHGGKDAGARYYGCDEKTLNLKTAIALKKSLQKRSYRVLMTRQRDEYVSIARRAEFVNDHQPDLLISVHYNSASSSEIQGVEIFYHGSKLWSLFSEDPSKKIAENVLSYFLKKTGAKSRGVKRANFYVLKQTQVPSILIEGGFISNREECSKLKNDLYIQKIVEGIADGVDAYFRKKK